MLRPRQVATDRASTHTAYSRAWRGGKSSVPERRLLNGQRRRLGRGGKIVAALRACITRYCGAQNVAVRR